MRIRLLNSENIDIDYNSASKTVVISTFEDNHFKDEYFLSKEQFEAIIRKFEEVK